MPVTKMLWNSDIKLLKRNNDNNTDIFCSKLSQNSNEEEKNSMATPISSHMKDINSIFTARDDDMGFK